MDEKVTLSGQGTPYRLNAWTGKVEPIGEYTRGRGGITVRARIAPYDALVIALVNDAAQPVSAPEVHATSSSAEIAAADRRTLTLRATKDGRYTTTLSDGRTVATTIDGLSSGRRLDTWTLQAQTWTPGINQHSTVKTDLPPVAVTAGEDGTLPSWREMLTPVALAASSGIGAYTAEIDLPTSWTSADGAYVDFGAVLDTAAVMVNGVQVPVNQSDLTNQDSPNASAARPRRPGGRATAPAAGPRSGPGARVCAVRTAS